jgi:hypothetical protein
MHTSALYDSQVMYIIYENYSDYNKSAELKFVNVRIYKAVSEHLAVLDIACFW